VFSFFSYRGYVAGAFLVALLCAGPALAQPTQSVQPTQPAQPPPTLREALDAAWALAASQRSYPQRVVELEARARAAGGWMAGPPSVTLAHRTDRLTRNAGLRELEAELAVPIWNTSARKASRLQIDADRARLERQLAASRLKLAGEVRELAAQAALARAEQTGAVRKLAEAGTLAQDVERRVRAGDVARVDALQAQAVVQQANASLVQAQAAMARVQSQWLALTGLAAVADPASASVLATVEAKSALASASDAVNPVNADHPALVAAAAHTQAARSRLALAVADRRDPVELSVGSSVTQGESGAGTQTSIRVAVKIPLGGDIRNAARIAAARAEVDTAEAESDAVTRQVNAELAGARAEVAAARANEDALQARARLSAEAQALYAKSYRLGESDLPTRLRADNERFDAEMAVGRARVETQRALSRLHQSLGWLP
jgi:outer membrane protein, heavy metal efflux system